MSDKDQALLSKIRSVAMQDHSVADRVKAIRALLDQMSGAKEKAEPKRTGGRTSKDRGEPGGKDRKG